MGKKYKCKSCEHEFNTPDLGIHEGVCPLCGSEYYEELPKEDKITKNTVKTVLLAYFQMVEDEQPSANVGINELAKKVHNKLMGR